MVWRIALLCCLLACVTQCTCERAWSPHDPTGCSLSESLFSGQERTYWGQTFGGSGSAVGCLQVAWGQTPAEARTAMVVLDAQGALRAVDDKLTPGGPPSVTLPDAAKGSSYRRFRLFLFHPQLGPKQDACAGAMARADYDCLSSTQSSTCWFAIDFQPRRSDVIAQKPASGLSCALSIRGRKPVEPRKPEWLPDGAIADRAKGELRPDERRRNDGGEPFVPKDTAREQPTPDTQTPDVPVPDTGPTCLPKQQKAFDFRATIESTGSVHISDIATDAAGDVYIAIYLTADGLLKTIDKPWILEHNSNDDLVLFKISQRKLKWGRSGLSNGNARPSDIAFDQARGRLYMAGRFGGELKFNKIPIGDQKLDPLQHKYFIYALDKDGGHIAVNYANNVDPGDLSEISAIAVGAGGAIYAAGLYKGRLCFLRGSCLPFSNSKVPFLAKFAADLSKTLWSYGFVEQVGGPANARVRALEVSKSGDLYLLFNFENVLQYKTKNLINQGKRSSTVIQFDQNGDVKRTIVLGGSTFKDVVSASSMRLGGDGFLYIGGSFQGAAKLGNFNLVAGSSSRDLFVAKMLPSGTVEWARGGSNKGASLVNDIDWFPGQVCVTGSMLGSIKLSGHQLVKPPNSAPQDPFIVCLRSDGNGGWAMPPPLSAAGAQLYNSGLQIAFLPDGQIVWGGDFSGSMTFGGQRVNPKKIGSSDALFGWICGL